VSPALLLSKLTDLARSAPDTGAPAEAEIVADAPAASDELAKAGIEVESLQTLEKVMTPEETREFVEGFCIDAADRIARMNAATGVEGIGPDAHALVSIAGNVGGMRISKLAKSIDAACKAGDLQTAMAILPSLTAAVNVGSAALQNWLTAKTG
jgi:HPt (histidine-containing phosphotransfer) domain-containing protein